ncbi:MAG: Ig-like domain-containing protein [Limnohabitans sp.]
MATGKTTNKQYKILVKTGKAENNQTIEIAQGAGDRGQTVRIKAQAGVKYQLQEVGQDKNVAPQYVKVKRVGKDLHIIFEDDSAADLIIEDYYSVMTEGYNGVIGQAENGAFYEYVPEDPSVKGLIPELAQDGQAVNVALGGQEVQGAGAALAVLAINPLLAALGAAGAAAAAGGGGGGGAVTPATSTSGFLATDSDSGAKGDNVTKNVNPELTGKATPGSTVSVTLAGPNGTTTGPYTAVVDANGNYSIKVPANLTDGTYTPKITVTPAGSTTGTTTDGTPFTIDNTAPTIAITADKGQLLAGQTTQVTFTVSEAVSDFQQEDVQVTGGSLSNWTKVSPTVYTATFTPTAGSTTTSTISVTNGRFSDAASNFNTDGADLNNNLAIPTSTKVGGGTAYLDPAAPNDSGVSGDNRTNDATPTLKGTVPAGSTASVTIGTQTYPVTVNPDGSWSFTQPTNLPDGTYTPVLNITTGSVTTPHNGTPFTIDTVPPSIVVTSDKAQLRTGDSATITFTLSEGVTDFVQNDVEVSGGTLSNFAQVSPSVYTATFTPTAASKADSVIRVRSGVFSDAAGNTNTDGNDTNNAVLMNTDTTVVDTTAPTIAISADKAALTAGQTAIITFTLSEASANFVQGDITVTGGTLSNFVQSSTDPKVYKAVFTPTPGSTAQAVISVGNNAFTDAAGNNNLDGADANNTVRIDTNTVIGTATASLASASDSGTQGDNRTLDNTPDITGTAPAGSTVSVTLSGPNGTTYGPFTATTDASGKYSLNVPTSLTDGTYTPAVTVTPVGGTAGAAVPGTPFTIDTVTTVAITNSGTAGTTNAIIGTAEAGDTITLKDVNGQIIGTTTANSAGQWSFTPTSPVAAGPISATAVDTSGNTAKADGNNSTGTANGKLDAGSDSGVLGDNNTNDNTPALSGKIPPGATATVTINGQTYPVTVKPDGSWNFTQPTNLPDGTYKPVLNVTPAGGGVPVATDITPFTIDTTAPVIAITADKASLLAGQTTTVTFTISKSATDSTVDTSVNDFADADITVTGGTLSNITGSNGVFTATFTPTANSTAPAVISVASSKFSDAANNFNTDGADLNNTLSIPTNTLAGGGTGYLSAATDSGTKGDNTTNNTTPGISGKAPAGSAVDVLINGVHYTTTAAPDGTYTIPAVNNLPDGTYVPKITITPAAAGSTPVTTDGTAFTIDTVAPTIAISSDKATLASGQTATITFTTSEIVKDFTDSDVLVTGGKLSNLVQSATDPKVYTATFTPTAGSTAPSVISVASQQLSDAAGNYNTDGADANNKLTLTTDTTGVDRVPPTIAISADKTALLAGQTSIITFTLSEASTDFTTADVSVTGGSIANLIQSTANPLVYTAVYTPNANSTVPSVIRVDSGKFTDAAGNVNADGADANNEVRLSTNTVITGTGTGALASSSDTGTAGDNLTQDNTPTYSGTAPAGSAVDVLINGVHYTTTADANGQYTINVPTALPDNTYTPVITVTPVGGTAGAPTNGTPFTIDTVAPTIVVSADKSSLTAGQTSTITFTVSEAVTDFKAEDVQVTGGTLSNFQGSGNTYTATYTPTAGSGFTGSVSVASGKFSDAAANHNTDGAEANNTVNFATNQTSVDSAPPTIAVARLGTGVLTSAETISFTISEATKDFTLSDVTYDTSKGTLSNFTAVPTSGTAGTGYTQYTATYTPAAGQNGSLTIGVLSGKFADAAGNQNKDTYQVNASTDVLEADNKIDIQVNTTANPTPTPDTTAPTISVARAGTGNLATGNTDTITFTLSENSLTFDQNDVTVTGGTLTNWAIVPSSGNASTGYHLYTATFVPTPGASGTATIGVTAGKFADAAGNNNLDTYSATADNVANHVVETNNQVSIGFNTNTVDTTAPKVEVIRTGTGTITGAETIYFNFTETTADFTLSDINAQGGTITNLVAVAGSNNTQYTATFTPNSGSTGTASIGVLAGKFSDTAGNLNTDTYDNTSANYEANNLVSATFNTTASPADTTAPTVAITRTGTNVIGNGIGASGTTETIVFTFSEPINPASFVTSDIDVSSGQITGLSAVAGSNNTQYTATYTPAAGQVGTATIGIASGKFSDTTGNLNKDTYANGVAGTVQEANNQISVAYNTDITPPNGGNALGLLISTDSNDDGWLNRSELVTNGVTSPTVTVKATFDGSKVDIGDKVTFTLAEGSTQTVTIDAAAKAANQVTVTVATPAEGQSLIVKAVLKDTAGNATPEATDTAKVDTSNFGPVDPNVDPANANKNITIDITTDAQGTGQGVLDVNELASGKINVKVGLSADAKAGDTLVVEGTGNVPQTITLSAAQVAAKEVLVSFANVPANGTNFVASAQLSDLAKNTSAKVTDSATINTNLAGAPGVVIVTDADNNGYINKAELGGPISVKITAPAGAVVGDTITVTDGVGVPQTFTLTPTQIANGITTTFPAPTDGSTLTITSTLTATGGSAPTGLVSAPGTDSAKLDLTDFSKVDPANPSGPRISAVGVNIDTDSNSATGDGIITAAELANTNGKIKVTISLPAGAAVGDTLTVNANGNSQRVITLTAADIAAGKYVITDYNTPGDNNTFNVTASIKDAAGNASPAPDATDSALMRTTISGAPVVVITEDGNDDGYINAAELNGTVGVNITIPTAAKAGDKLIVTINGTPETIVLTAAQIAAQTITREVTPVNGQAITVKAVLDVGGQLSAEGSDTAMVDTSASNGGNALGLTIDPDTNDDGWLNRSEIVVNGVTQSTVSVTAKFDATKVEVGDKIIFTLPGGSQQTVTIDAAAQSAGKVTLNVPTPAEGQSMTVKAVLKDSAGNLTPEATDTAKVDTSNFGPDTNPANADKNIAIDITTDAQGTGQGVLDVNELASGKILVKVGLSADAKAGDTLIVEGTGNVPQTITLSAAQVAAKEVLVTFANVPANGTTFVASAQLSDLAKNTSAKVTDSATINTNLAGAPGVQILEDADSNGYINKAELSGNIDVKITVPAGAVVGDTITVTDGVGVPQTFTLTATQIANGILTSFAAPADGSNFVVTATLTATGGSAPTGLVSAPGTDSAKLDLTDFSKVDPANPSGPRISAVGVNIDTDNNSATGDGIITAAELANTNGKIKVTISLPAGAAAGDTLTVNASGNSQRVITLTTADIAAGKYVISDYSSVTNGNTFTVSASIKDAAGNASPAPDASDSAIMRTTIAGAPVVTITEDGNDDGYINAAELSGTVGVTITIPAAAKAGDTLKVTINGTPENIVLTAAQISAGVITKELPAPADGSTINVKAQLIDTGNQASPEGSDTAVIDTTLPNSGNALGLTIDTDGNNDGWINRAELGNKTSLNVSASFDKTKVAVGDKITFTLTDGSTQSVTLDAAAINAGQVTLTNVPVPAEGQSANIKAILKDVAGNTTPEATDSAKVDTSNFGPDTNPANASKNVSIVITSDADNGGAGNGVLGVSELVGGKINVKVALSADAKAGDTLVVEGTGNTPQTFTLSAEQVAAGQVLTSFNAPANGTNFVATAELSDLAKNTSGKVTDSATIDTNLAGAPKVEILEDANNNGYINKAELIGQIDVKVTVPTGAQVGDTITVSDGVNVPQTITLTANQIANGILTSFAAPADGSNYTVTATLKAASSGNVSAPGTDSAKLDLTDFSKVDPANPSGPRISAVGVNIDTDAPATGDGIITAAELAATNGTIKVTISLPAGAAVGDTLTVKASNNNDRIITLTQAQIDAHQIVITDYNTPGDSNTFTVTASIQDAAGNASPAPDAADSAIMRTVIAGAPVVVITEDTNNDTYINSTELSGTIGVNVGIPSAAKAGDRLIVTINGTPETIVLTTAQIAASTITKELPVPADGSSITVKAQLIDQGNQASAEGTDTDTLDTSAPVGAISIDAITGDDLITGNEATGTVTISGKVTGEYRAGDNVTISVGGANYNGTVNAAGLYSISGVDGSKFGPDSDHKVDASVLAHDAAGNSGTYTATPRPYTMDSDTHTEAAKTALSLDPVTGDNIITVAEGGVATTTLTGKATGTFAAGDVVTITLDLPTGLKTYTGTVNAQGNYSIPVPTAELIADTDTKVEARIAATVGSSTQTAVAAQDYVVETGATAGKLTALSIDPVTADNIIVSTESTGNIILTGKVTGAFAATDIVTIMVNGTGYTGTAGNGSYSIVVPAAQLVLDANTQIEGSVTGTGGTLAHAMQNYAVVLNGPPVNTVPAAQTVAEDTQLAISGISVNDADGNLATTQISVLHGNLNVTLSGGATISAGANGSGTLTLSGNQTDINATLASLKYTGASNYNGADTLTVLSTDSQGVTDSDTVAITVTAVADNATIGGDTTGAATEDATVNTATGTLTVTDGDAGEASLQAPTPASLIGTYGSFALNTATGVWTYTLNNNLPATQALTAGQKVSDKLTVKSFDGTATQDITVTITGVNDTATITGQAVGDLTEDATTTVASGKLTVADVDTGEAVFQTPTTLAGTYGTYTLNTGTGDWTYTLDNTKAATNALKTGDTVFDTVTVKSADGTASQEIKVTIHGHDDAATLGGTLSGNVTEDTTATASGTVIVTDGDAGQASLQTPSSTQLAGTYGSFALNSATGAWTYTLDNTKPATQALAAGAQVTDKLTVTSADGSASTDISVTVTGTNDAPVVNGNVNVNDIIYTDPLGAAKVLTYTSVGTVFLSANSGGNVDESKTWTVTGNPVAIKINYTYVDNDAGGHEVIHLSINGQPYQFKLSNVLSLVSSPGGTNLTPVISTDGYTLDYAYVANAGATGVLQILASEVPGGVINSVMVTNDVIATSAGAQYSLSTGAYTTGAGAVTDAKTVNDLFGPTFTDVDTGDAFRGVTITSAGQGTEATSLGKYQYQKAGTSTWTDLPTGLTDGTAIYLAKADLIRFVPSSTNTSAYAKPDLTARLVDSAATTAPVTGDVIDVSGVKHGGSTDYSGDTATLRVGPNTTATITGTATGAVTEDDAAKNTASGVLTVTDPDAGQALLQTPSSTQLAGTYGNFTLNPTTGAWTYTLDNSKPATQALTAGQQVTDTLTVASADSTATKPIVVTVTGVNDTATITGPATGDLTEDATITVASGKLTVADVDTGEAAFATPTTLTGTYGTYTLNTATGDWMYTLDNSKAATNALKTGDTVYDTITVKSLDGTASKDLKVTIHGADEISLNNAPVANTDVNVNDVIKTDLLGAAGSTSPVALVNTSGSYSLTGSATYTMTANQTSSAYLGGDNQAGNYTYGFSQGQVKINMDLGAINNTYTGYTIPTSPYNAGIVGVEYLSVYINGTAYKLKPSNFVSFVENYTGAAQTPFISSDGYSFSAANNTIGNAKMVFNASDVPEGVINSISIRSTVMSGTPYGVIVSATATGGGSSAAKTVQDLFGATFTDVDAGNTFRGVTITSAGVTADVSAKGVYQYQKAGTTTWTTLAADLNDTKAVFLAPTDLVRFVASSTNTDPYAKPDLVARLVDSSASTAPVTGAVIDVSGALHGGSTAYSGDTVTLQVDGNAAPVANPTVLSNVFAATATAPEVTITDDQSAASVANGTQVTYTLKFSEAIKASTLLESDVTVTNGTLVAGSLTQVDATTWTVKASAPATGSGATAITLADGSYTSATGVAGVGSSGTQGYAPVTTAITAVIDGTTTGANGQGKAPDGWTVHAGTPDLNDYVNTTWAVNYGGAGSYVQTNLNGISTNGGTYAELFGSTGTAYYEGISKTITGLTAGQTYVYGVEWQQITMTLNNGWVNSGGQLKMTIDGVSKVFTSTGLSDGWQKVFYTFTASGSTAVVDLDINPAADYVGSFNGGLGGAIAVDSLSLDQITSNYQTAVFSGTAAADVLTGTDTAETFNIATAASTTATGTDKVYAGAGNDTVIFNDFNASVMNVDGGSGVNTLQMSNSSTIAANVIDLTNAAVRARVHNFNSIDLTGTAANTLKLNWAAVVALSGTTDVTGTAADESKMLVVSGNAGDTLNLVNLTSWNVGAAQTAADLTTIYGSAYNFLAGHTYKAYTLNGATVFVDQAIATTTLAATAANTPVAYSQAVTIESLFGPQNGSTDTAYSFTDSNTAGTANATFKGVALTNIGAAADFTSKGFYQLSKDGGATWIDLKTAIATGDVNDIYADKDALIRYAGATGVEVINPQDLTARLIDNSGLTGTSSYNLAATGTTINASVNGGTTAFSGGNSGGVGNTVTTNLLNRAPVSSDADGVVYGDLLGAVVVTQPSATFSAFTGNGSYTVGNTSVTVTGNTGTVLDSGSALGSALWLGDANVTETANFAFNKPVAKVVVDFTYVSSTSASSSESVGIYINGQKYILTAANLSGTNATPIFLADGSVTSTIASFTGKLTINSSDVPGGINSFGVSNIIIAGQPSGADYKVTVTSESDAATASKTVQDLFGATYTDADFDTMRGVVITSAGTGSDVTNLGKYQYSTNGGTTWLDLAGGLSDSSSVFLAKTDLVRFVPSASNTSLTNKSDLTARLVDDSAAVAPTSGATVDVSGALHGGSTPYSDTAVTLRAPAAPVGVADTITATEKSGSNNAIAGIDPSGNVLTNDTDTDNATNTLVVQDVLKGTSGTASTVTAGTTSNTGTSIVGDYGTLVMGADGTYAYTVNQSNAAVQALNVGSTALNDTFTYTVKDPSGLTSKTTLTVAVNGANDAPILATALADATVTQNNAFSYTVPAAAFTDVDSTLTYTATGMPAGVTFNAATRTFSGYPSVAGNFNVTVTASDGTLSVSDVFAVNVAVDPLIASLMSIPLTGLVQSSVSAFASFTNAPAYVTGGTMSVYDSATNAVVFTRSSWDGGAFTNSLSTVNFTPVVGHTYYVTLNYPSGASYRLKNSVTFNGTSTKSTEVDILTSPLVLDLNGDGVQTMDLSHAVAFDLTNSGDKQRVSWIDKHDGLLAVDLNGDGQINGGAELLGSSTKLADGSVAKDGWAALGAMDTNGDGKVDAQDANFDKLRVWVDANGDGVTDAGELKTLADVGIASFDVKQDNSVTQQNGNVLLGAGKYTTTDGQTHAMTDAWLQMTPFSVKTLINGESLDLSNLNSALIKSIDMSTDTAANTLKLNLSDVLSLPTTNGVHKLTLTGDANDTVDLDIAHWTNTGTTVTENGHSYAVYSTATDSSAQLLIDQHMLMTQHS